MASASKLQRETHHQFVTYHYHYHYRVDLNVYEPEPVRIPIADNVIPESVVVTGITDGIPDPIPEARVEETEKGKVEVVIPAMDDPPDEIVVEAETEPMPQPQPQPKHEFDDGTIWHVMYRNDDGQVSVYVYPRCFNNRYHSPPRPPCENDYGINEDTFFEVSRQFLIELQGTSEDVNYLLNLKLTEDSATLAHVGSVQGVVMTAWYAAFNEYFAHWMLPEAAPRGTR